MDCSFPTLLLDVMSLTQAAVKLSKQLFDRIDTALVTKT
jgi:hypothetical protein